MATIGNRRPMNKNQGAIPTRLALNISGLNSDGFSDPPPSISPKPIASITNPAISIMYFLRSKRNVSLFFIIKNIIR